MIEFKINKKDIVANGYFIKNLNMLTTAFIEFASETPPNVDDEVEVLNASDSSPIGTSVFKGYINGVNKIEEGYLNGSSKSDGASYKILAISSSKFNQKTTIDCYKEEDFNKIVENILKLSDLQVENSLEGFDIDWIPQSTPALSLLNLFSIYETRKGKKVYWYDIDGKICIFDEIKEGAIIKNRVYERRRNIIIVDNKSIPNIFDTIEGRIITGYKLTNSNLELYVK